MYFCNLVGDAGIGTIERGKGLKPFVNEHTDVTFKGGIVEEEDCIRVVKGVDGQFGELGISVEGLGDSEENPLIWVLCREAFPCVRLENYFKHIVVGDDLVLICLIRGAMDFGGTVLERGIREDIKVEIEHRVLLDSKKLAEISDFEDKEIGASKEGYGINETSIKVSKSAESPLTSSRIIKNGYVLIDRQGFQNKLKEKQEADRKALERQREKEAKEEALRVEREEALEKERALREAKRKKKLTEDLEKASKAEIDENGANLGAMAFLKSVGK